MRKSLIALYLALVAGTALANSASQLDRPARVAPVRIDIATVQVEQSSPPSFWIVLAIGLCAGATAACLHYLWNLGSRRG